MPRPGAAQPAAEPAAPAASDDAGLDNPLTTKEGWRRFVDKEPAPPPLLGEAERAALSTARRGGYAEARVDSHADLPDARGIDHRQVGVVVAACLVVAAPPGRTQRSP